MGKNLCMLDRIVRVGLGVVLAAAGIVFVRGVLGVVMALIGVVLIFSGSIGFCHVYKFVGDVKARRL